MSLHDINDLKTWFFAILFNECYIVTYTEFVFQIMATSTANKFASSHNTDSISKIIGLVHEMCREKNNSVGFVAF